MKLLIKFYRAPPVLQGETRLFIFLQPLHLTPEKSVSECEIRAFKVKFRLSECEVFKGG